jgi:hypothetical protein
MIGNRYRKGGSEDSPHVVMPIVGLADNFQSRSRHVFRKQ